MFLCYFVLIQSNQKSRKFKAVKASGLLGFFFIHHAPCWCYHRQGFYFNKEAICPSITFILLSASACLAFSLFTMPLVGVIIDKDFTSTKKQSALQLLLFCFQHRPAWLLLYSPCPLLALSPTRILLQQRSNLSFNYHRPAWLFLYSRRLRGHCSQSAHCSVFLLPRQGNPWYISAPPEAF